MEGAQGADSPGGAPDTVLPPGTSPCFWLDEWVAQPLNGFELPGGRTLAVFNVSEVLDFPSALRGIYRNGFNLEPGVEGRGDSGERAAFDSIFRDW